MKNFKKVTLVLSMFLMVFMLFSCEKEDTIDPATQVALNQQKLIPEMIEKISNDPDVQSVIYELMNQVDESGGFDMPKFMQEVDDYQNNVIINEFVELGSLSEEDRRHVSDKDDIRICNTVSPCCTFSTHQQRVACVKRWCTLWNAVL